MILSTAKNAKNAKDFFGGASVLASRKRFKAFVKFRSQARTLAPPIDQLHKNFFFAFFRGHRRAIKLRSWIETTFLFFIFAFAF